MKDLITSIAILLLLTSFTFNNAFAQRPTKKSLNRAVVDGDIDQVKSEISAGADVNTKDGRTGWTLLYIAINKKHTEIAQFLIEKGADVNIRDNRGRTPVHLAVETGQKDIVEALIAKGADLNVLDSNADNALTLARKNNQTEITELLLKNGAKEPDLSLLQRDRLYSLPGGQAGANSTGSYQARASSIPVSQSTAQVNILADPNEIKSRIKTFDGLEKELKEVTDKSQEELRHWPQSRYDNRTTLARSIDKQVEEELQYVRKVAVKESAKKTTEAIDNLLKIRQERYTKVNRELLQQKRETRQTTSARTSTRGRTTGRSARGQYSQRGQAYGTNATNNLYGGDSINTPRGYGAQNPAQQPEQLDPQTQEEIRLWLQTTPDKKLELARAVHPLIQSEIGYIRAIAVEEQAKKTTAAIDGLLLARQDRFDKIVIEMEQEQRKLQEAQSMQTLPNDPGQAYQQGGRYSGQTRRGTGTQTQGNNPQQQSTRRTRRR
ncbi:MAG: ankyrin repeat domain-containing protein [Sedimentisphaerales bacterium]|nr:ankyrin repeat domain-containing protein [Sedimentisphaerales bacterium]